MPLVLGVDALAGTTVKDLVREVASRPTNPTVLYNFAATLERSGKDSLAAVVYMRALDFETEGSEEWAETVAAIFCKLIQPQCDGVPKPAWWDDQKLLSLSQRVLEAAPQSPAVCVMRADVLAGPSQDEWPAAAPRSAEQLSVAGRLYLNFADANERQGQPLQQVAVLRQLAVSCAKRAREDQDAQSIALDPRVVDLGSGPALPSTSTAPGAPAPFPAQPTIIEGEELDGAIASAIDGALDRELKLRELAISSKRMRSRSLSDEVA